MSDSEEVYEVEAVLAHRKSGKKYSYKLKWRGYGDEHNTWEDADNVFCDELVAEYWKNRGEEIPRGAKRSELEEEEEGADAGDEGKRGKRRKRESKGRRSKTEADDLEVEEETPTKLQEKLNWNNLRHVDTIERKADGSLAVWVQWKNGTQTAVSHEVAKKNCPQALIEFYERHLKFHEVTDENE